MAQTAKNVLRFRSEWLCRDIDAWRVRVPCQGGSGRFRFTDFGGSEKALKAAKIFQRKAIKQLKTDREYAKKHGELPVRETIYITNRSGIRGVCRIVTPNMEGPPLVTWIAQWSGPNGRRMYSSYSTAQYTEAEAKRRAIQKRKEMMAHILLPTN